MATMHGNSGGGGEDPDTDASDMVHLCFLLSRDVPDSHDFRSTGERDGHQDRILLCARGFSELCRGDLHDDLGCVAGQHRDPASQKIHRKSFGTDAPATDGHRPVPGDPSFGRSRAGRDVEAAQRQSRPQPEHRMAAPSVRGPGLLRRVLRHSPARVLLLRGAHVQAQPVLGVPVPGDVAPVLGEHARHLARRCRDQGRRQAGLAPC
jgi:hypothetical protein